MGRMRLIVNGQELRNWVSASLTRRKSDLTGELSVDLFYANIPPIPVLGFAVQGVDIAVYVDNHLVFYGVIDTRQGRTVMQPRDAKGRFARGQVDKSYGGELQRSIGQDGYSIRLVARGQTKYLIDCSHSHQSGTMRRVTDRHVIEELVRPYNIAVDCQAEPIQMERVVLRDGAVVADEIFRICNENCHFVYETRDGRLRVIDHVTEARGDNIILGQNILTVIAEQSESRANSEIRVKGHRNERGIWGRDAIIDAEIRVQDDWVSRHSPLTLQHYGDASPEALRRRAKWEADKRASESKNIRVEVFDLVDRNGVPWDIGQLHYVEIPPEGIFTDMECIELTYRGDIRGTLNNELTLAPQPSKEGKQAGQNALLNNAPSNQNNQGAAQAARAGVRFTNGQYPAQWVPAALTAVAGPVAAVATLGNALLANNNSQGRGQGDGQVQQQRQRPAMRLSAEE